MTATKMAVTANRSPSPSSTWAAIGNLARMSLPRKRKVEEKESEGKYDGKRKEMEHERNLQRLKSDFNGRW